MAEEIITAVIDLPTSTPSNFDDFEKLLHHTFYNELRVAPEETPVLLTESSFSNVATREKITQIMFETFNVPVLLILPSSVLNLYAIGKETGLSIQSGETATEIVPVVDGIPLRNIAVDYPINGMHITGYLHSLLPGVGGGRAATNIIKDIKKTKGFVSLDPSTQVDIKKNYQMPDDSLIELDNSSWLVAEPLFYPELVSVLHSPLSLTILNIVNNCPKDKQAEILQNIVLGGGNTQFAGFAERLQKELETLISNEDVKVKVHSDASGGHGTWVGGSIRASMSDFLDKCLTMDKYNEFGPVGIHEVCK